MSRLETQENADVFCCCCLLFAMRLSAVVGVDLGFVLDFLVKQNTDFVCRLDMLYIFLLFRSYNKTINQSCFN